MKRELLFLIIALTFSISFSFAAFSSYVHALTLGDVIDAIVSALTGQTQTSALTGAVVSQTCGCNCQEVCTGGARFERCRNVCTCSSVCSNSGASCTTNANCIATTSSTTATITSISTQTTTTTCNVVCPTLCAECGIGYQGGGCYYINASTCTCVPPRPCVPNCVYGTATATNSVNYGSYKIYATLGSTNNWAKIEVKDSAGNSVETKIINQLDAWDFSGGFTLRVVNVAALQDGTVIRADIAVGPTGTYCPYCTDSDGGKNYYVKGTCASCISSNQGGGCGGVIDSCSDSTLKECYCEGGSIASINYLCPNGCIDGACVSVPINYQGIRNDITAPWNWRSDWHYSGTIDGLTVVQAIKNQLGNDNVGGVMSGSGLHVVDFKALDKAVAYKALQAAANELVSKGYAISYIDYWQSSITTTTTTQTCISTPCEWGIQYKPAAGAGNGIIPKGSKIQVVYKPATTKYINAGEKISSPNNYFDLQYLGFNTDKFANVYINPAIGLTIYDASSGVMLFGNLNGLKFSTDVANSLSDEVGTTYNTLYILFRRVTDGQYSVLAAYYDAVKQKIVVDRSRSDTFINLSSTKPTTDGSLRLKYGNTGDQEYFIAFNININNPNIFENFYYGKVTTSYKANIDFKNRTVWGTSSSPEFKLGNSTGVSESGEIKAITEGVTWGVGTSHNDVVTDCGLIVKNPNENGLANQVALKVPDKELKTKVNLVYPGHSITTDIRLDQSFSVDYPNNGIENLGNNVFPWKGNDYDYHHQVDMSGIQMRHDYGTTLISGNEKMVVESGDMIYEFVFDKDLNFGGSITNPEYTYPVKIKLMDKDFIIVGAGTSSIKVLAGNMGTATATSGVSYGGYIVYAETGVNNQWARLLIKDKSSNTVDTKVIDEGNSADSSVSGLTIKVIDVRTLQDGTIIGVDLIAGPIGQIEKEYDTSADVTSTGITSDCFPGTTQVCKKPCPYECCQSDPLYLDKLCSQVCPTCPAGQTCPPCLQLVCQDHKCVSSGTHDIGVTSFYAPCTETGSTCGITVYENQNFVAKGTITNLGGYTETVSLSISACPSNVVTTTTTIVPTTQSSAVATSSSSIACKILYSGNIILEAGKSWDIMSLASLPAGSYRLTLSASISSDSNPSNNYQTAYVTVREFLPTYTLNFKAGWNLFSVPVSYITSTNNINCVPASPVYGLSNGNYYEVSTPSGGYGYWIKMASDCTINVTGRNITISDFPSLSAGWNMIGAPTNAIDKAVNFDDVKGTCTAERGLFWYDPSLGNYIVSNVLQSGRGYFVKLKESCRLGTGLPPPPPS